MENGRPSLRQSAVNDRIFLALTELYAALAEANKHRDAIMSAIHTLRLEFHELGRTHPGRPRKTFQAPSVDSPPDVQLSSYPSAEILENNADLSDLHIDFSGTTNRAERLERIAQVANEAGRYLRPKYVALYLVKWFSLDTPWRQEALAVGRIMREHPDQYIRTATSGVYRYVPPAVAFADPDDDYDET